MPGDEIIRFIDSHPVLVAAGVASLFVASIAINEYWRNRRARRIAERWAARNNFHLVLCEKRRIARGPFRWDTRAQIVFRARVEFPDGRAASAWLRCGSSLVGMLSNQIAVRWDEAPDPGGFPVVFPMTPTDTNDSRP